ncbi:MAG: ABC transporter substrate-binding protein [Deltaproteobacteria bacterium]|nr:MAG: ABC transporter substrate-binding protein [Deltaproteobacteria bacterium]
MILTLTLMLVWPNFVEPAAAKEPATYRLKWLFNASVVGDLYADVHNLFAAKGLDVTVKEGGPERDAIRELEMGRAQFGVASADQVIRALDKGAAVVVIAQLFQINPLQWIYRPEKFRIDRLEDLKGKKLGVTFGGNDETILRTLLAKAGITEKDVTLFSVRYDYTPFYKHKVNFWPVYRNTQAIILSEKLRKEGEPVAFFNPAEFGVRFVANSVITSPRMIQEHPATVRNFTEALMLGWTQALDFNNHPKAIKTLQRFDKDTPVHILDQQLNETRKLIQPTPGFKVGTIDVAAWKQTEKIMLDQKQISTPVFVEKVLKSYIPY